MAYHQHYSTRSTSQDRPIPGKQQVKNTAGGYAFPVDDWTALRRFLILGSEGGTYYIGERDLTIQNAEAVQRCIAANGLKVVQEVVDVSDSGRAPKNDPALFVLAMCTAASDPRIRQAAWQALPKVARIGTHLFQFAEYREAFGGWGRLARKGVGNWYRQKGPEALAVQVLKYQQRNGWSHRDILRLCHATGTPEQNAIFAAVTHPDKRSELTRPKLFEGVDKAHSAKTAAEVAQVVEEYGLTREMVPTEYLSDPTVYEALCQRMPMTAMVRNLGNMSKIGLLKPLSKTAREVVSRLEDPEKVKKARLHPLALLTALKTYAQGKGMRGRGEWTPVPQVVDALGEAMRLSFDAVEPTGKRFVYGVDVSGSMSWATCMEFVTCAEAAAVMALVGAKTEPDYYIGGFAGEFRNLGITARDTFESTCNKTRGMTFGRTDCALPMVHALNHGIEADVFEILTDNETWAGNIHPVQALDQYRQKTGIPAKLVVVGMASNGFSIADPNDAGMLDVVGMDTSVPAVIADFAR